MLRGREDGDGTARRGRRDGLVVVCQTDFQSTLSISLLGTFPSVVQIYTYPEIYLPLYTGVLENGSTRLDVSEHLASIEMKFRCKLIQTTGKRIDKQVESTLTRVPPRLIYAI